MIVNWSIWQFGGDDFFDLRFPSIGELALELAPAPAGLGLVSGLGGHGERGEKSNGLTSNWFAKRESRDDEQKNSSFPSTCCK